MNFKFYYELNNLIKYLHVAYKINYGGCLMVAATIKKALDEKQCECKIMKMTTLKNGVHYFVLLENSLGINKFPRWLYIEPCKYSTYDQCMEAYNKVENWSQKYDRKNDKIVQDVITRFIQNRL